MVTDRKLNHPWRLVACLLTISLGLPASVLAQGETPDEAKSSPAALAAYADAANFQNNGAFELAAEEWSSFLSKHGQDPLAGKAQHYLGVCQLQLKQFAKAEEAFAKVAQWQDFEFLEDALLNLGWCQYSQASAEAKDKYTSAAATFSRLLDEFPKGKLADQAAFFRGESLYAIDKTDEAIRAYQQVIQNYPQSDLRCDALYALGVSFEEQSKFREAGAVYDAFLKDCRESSMVTEVKMRKAETLLQSNQLDEAADLFNEVSAIPDFADAAHALSRKGLVEFKQEKFTDAGATYARVAERFPDSTHAVDAAISAGRSFFRAGLYDDAVRWFRQVIDRQSRDAAEAGHWLCRILLLQKKPNDVLTLVPDVLANAANSPYILHLKLDEADALFALPDRREDALNAYSKLADENPDHDRAPQARYNAAFAALDLRRFDDGLEQTRKFLKQYADHLLIPDVRYVEAECRMQQRDPAAAEKIYAELVDQYPQHSEIEQFRLRLASSRYLQKKYADVVQSLGASLNDFQKRDQRAEAEFLIGLSHFYQENYESAAQQMRASLLTSTNWRQADESLLYLARCQLKLGQHAEATKTVDALISKFPDSALQPQAHYRLGEIRYAAGDYAAAQQAYQTVAERWPDSSFTPYARFGLGWSLLKGKDYPAAAASFQQLLSSHPDHELASEARFARGMCLRQDGRLDDALADLEQFLAGDVAVGPRCDALFEKGLTLIAQQDWKAAADSFASLLKLQPKYANADRVLYEWAWARKSQQDASAVQLFERLASEYPRSEFAPEAWFHVGEQRYADEAYSQAAQAYAQALKQAKEGELGEKAAYKLGWSNFQQNKLDQAEQQFQKQTSTYSEGPLLADGLFMLGECQFKQDKFADALASFARARELPPPSPQVGALTLLHGAQAARQRQQWKDSLTWLKSLEKSYPESSYLAEAAFEMGEAHRNLDQLEPALTSYRRAAEKSRGSVGARAEFMIGEIEFNRKNYREAIKGFQRVMFGYGSERAPADVKSWQARAGYEAARCSDVQIATATGAKRNQLIAEAVRYYTYVVEKHPRSELVAQARKRLDSLAQLVP